MEGASGTLYEGEKFQLLFKFSSRYPFDSPQVRCRLHALISKLIIRYSTVVFNSFMVLHEVLQIACNLHEIRTQYLSQ